MASALVKASPAEVISSTRPSSRSRGRARAGVKRADMTTLRRDGSCLSSRSRECSVFRSRSSCTSSRTRYTAGPGPSMASTNAERKDEGKSPTGAPRSAAGDLPAHPELASTAASTADHSLRTSLSPLSRDTHATAASVRFTSRRAHSASRVVFPDPAEAQTKATSRPPSPSAQVSRSSSRRGRRTSVVEARGMRTLGHGTAALRGDGRSTWWVCCTATPRRGPDEPCAAGWPGPSTPVQGRFFDGRARARGSRHPHRAKMVRRRGGRGSVRAR